MIEVLAGGPLSTVQDRGRVGLRRLGVPRAGVLVPAWMTLANALVRNAPDTPVVECFEGGLRLAVRERPARVAHVGDADVVRLRDGERRTLAPWRSHTVRPGDEVAVRGTGVARLAVIAIHAFSVPSVLGSVSTYARAGLGGIDGRALLAGDRLRSSDDPDDPDGASGGAEDGGHDHRTDAPGANGPDIGCAPYAPATPAGGPAVTLRAVPGPQADAFDASTLATFFETLWTLSTEADRMGARLDGPLLAHTHEGARDIVSDAIVPGSVQVPGAGQPIIMLADAHTAGGYPKIATVVSSDLARIAIQRPGTRFRLERLDVESAIRGVRDDARRLARHVASIAPIPPDTIDTARLLAHNLVDGVTDGADVPPPSRT